MSKGRQHISISAEGQRPGANMMIKSSYNKTKVISADLLDLDFDFEDIIMFGNISVLVTFQFW